MVNIFYDFLHLFENGNFLNYPLNLQDLSVYIDNRNNFLFLNFNLPDFLNDSWHFDYFLHYSLNVLVDSDNLRDNFLDFNDFRNFDQFRYDFLNLINARNCS